MALQDYAFTEEDLVVDEGLGYPKAYAKLCRNGVCEAYGSGPPFTFTPYPMQKEEMLRAKEMEELFPVVNPKAKPTKKPKIFAGLLWKQLSHLGNAGFDPAVIRVDSYGNVVYFHADKASPLAWDIDHWFPCQRGGLTVPSNLRILQWQVYKRKHKKLEFLVPWWDRQLGISVNQFLSIFAASDSDFRHRAFSFLFSEGENEELNASQTVESHSFPQHFTESKEQLGLAPAAIVTSRREFSDSSLAFRPLDYNKQIRPPSPPVAARKVKPGVLKENQNPDFVANPYQAIVMARDSLKQREEAQKMQGEIQKLDIEVSDMKRMNDQENLTIQDLELALIKRRRRAEKCRKLAEAQSSYRTMLEKMIRDAMHQSVIYKEQVRLNQAATNALMARLEAQKAICDASEKELRKKFKQRDELEKQIRPEWEQARKRSRMDDTLSEDRENKTVIYLPGNIPRTPQHKELRVLLEEQKASEAGLSANEDEKDADIEEKLLQEKSNIGDSYNDCSKAIVVLKGESPIQEKLKELDIGEEIKNKIQFPVICEQEIEEDEESRRQRGKGNLEKWLQMLLENAEEDIELENMNGYGKCRTDEIIAKLNEKFPQKEANTSKQNKNHPQTEANLPIKMKADRHIHFENHPQTEREEEKGRRMEENVEMQTNKAITEQENLEEVGNEVEAGSSKTFDRKERIENRNERGLSRSESRRTLRRTPSSPLILGMRKGVECMRKKKPLVIDDDDCNEDHAAGMSFIKSSFKTIKKAVKI